MATPDFILDLRSRIGTRMLWLSGVTVGVHRPGPGGTEWLLVRNAETGRWSPVTGIIDPGEHPYQAAVREVAEEAAVDAEIERLVWQDITDVVTYSNGDQTQYMNNTFRTRWVAGDPRPADGENVEAAFFAESDLPPMSAQHSAAMRVLLADAPECGLGAIPAA
ncbi:MAG TPA: NUDIX domain-containing protein [Propioniciclava sp.]|jgi:8-oxo-dGTP pyrophosphatase MutT (NUDIX family)|uniref:NUDIX hydrolase n=1 Tax=Propioniciclava sp. TaxID=2038686 RepID=UPI002BA1932C|nr:NUDIX domain-containing protein [Propioniciclava sp.]HRL79518.1 NUDIX domain-containing protein [Propioniciclava sp.]